MFQRGEFILGLHIDLSICLCSFVGLLSEARFHQSSTSVLNGKILLLYLRDRRINTPVPNTHNWIYNKYVLAHLQCYNTVSNTLRNQTAGCCFSGIWTSTWCHFWEFFNFSNDARIICFLQCILKSAHQWRSAKRSEDKPYFWKVVFRKLVFVPSMPENEFTKKKVIIMFRRINIAFL